MDGQEKTNITPALLQKFHAGDCTPDEEKIVQNWLEADDLWIDGELIPNDEELQIGDKIWERLRAEDSDDLMERNQNSLSIRKRKNTWYLLPIGAVALLLLCGVWVMWSNWYQAQNVDQQRTVVVPYASKGEVTLSDGTTVYLNAGSKLVYPIQFNRLERIVHLSGEGFFEVSRDPSRPFQIVTDDAIVEVLGTAFNLTAYPGEEQQLQVVSGAVCYKSVQKKEQLIVKAGERVLRDEQQTIRYGDPVVTKSALWRDDTIVFDNKTLKEVAHVLERLYDVRIIFDNGLLEELRFSGTFVSAPLKSVLDDIVYVLKIEYNAKDQEIHFT